jgi:ABC-type branched-subunit amino acid transport system ATPase component/ABC-type branched-subunit amino acid transport system permease subunit
MNDTPPPAPASTGSPWLHTYRRFTGGTAQIRWRLFGRNIERTWATVLLIAVVALPLLTTGQYWTGVGFTAALFVILAVGLNITVGLGGLLDLGYIAFYLAGAYTTAMLMSGQFDIHLPFAVSLALAASVAGTMGLLVGLPALRLTGDYLAIVTLGLGQVVFQLVLNADWFTGGPRGVYGVERPSLFGWTLTSVRDYYALAVGAAIVVTLLGVRLRATPLGRGLVASRDDEHGARATGVSPTRVRIVGFTIAAALAGVSGSLLAIWQRGVSPDNFPFLILILLYLMVVIGGLGSAVGVAAGAVVVTFLAESLREFQEWRMILFGVALLAVLRLRPSGLIVPRARSGATEAETAAQEASGYRYSLDVGRLPAPAGTAELRCHSIEKSYGGLKVLDAASFVVRSGEIVALIGPNGAGKTSALDAVSGVISLDAGTVELNGSALPLSSHRVARRGVRRTFQNVRIFPGLTVRENILVALDSTYRSGSVALLLGLPWARRKERAKRERADYLLGLFGERLAPRADDLAQTLSYANRRRLELVRALAGEPSVLLLDEPGAGMNPSERRQLTEILRALRDRGFGVVIVEHHLELVFDIADRVVAMDRGAVLADDQPDIVRANGRVIESYLGKRGSINLPPRSAPMPHGDGSDGSPLLELSRVDAFYGPIQALHEVSLQIHAGEFVSLLGGNASGKSTTIKTVLGRVRVTRGEVRFRGEPITNMRTSAVVRRGIAHVPENRRLFPGLTVLENLEMGAFHRLSEDHDADFSQIYDLFPVLFERGHQQAGSLSGGEQQMLAVSRALVSRPELICIDEPSMGLAPRFVEVVYDTIKKVNGTGVAVLVVEQAANVALAVADRAYILSGGRIVLSGDAADLLEDARVQEAYLGKVAAPTGR